VLHAGVRWNVGVRTELRGTRNSSKGLADWDVSWSIRKSLCSIRSRLRRAPRNVYCLTGTPSTRRPVASDSGHQDDARETELSSPGSPRRLGLRLPRGRDACVGSFQLRTPLHGWHPCPHLDFSTSLTAQSCPTERPSCRGPGAGRLPRRDCVRKTKTGLGESELSSAKGCPEPRGRLARTENRQNCSRASMQLPAVTGAAAPQPFRFAGDPTFTVDAWLLSCSRSPVACLTRCAAMISKKPGANESRYRLNTSQDSRGA